MKRFLILTACVLALAGCASSGKVERNAVTCAMLGKAAVTAVAKHNGDVSSQQAKDDLKLALVTALLTPQAGAAVPVEADKEAKQALVNELIAKLIINDKLTEADIGNAVYTACMTK